MVVAAALLREDGKILLQQRRADRAMGGLWEFPGGKVEAGERPETALARELHEELGISVAEAALEPIAFASADNQGRHMLLLLYVCREWRGIPQALDAAELVWLRSEEMGCVAMPPADMPLVAALGRLSAGEAPR
jgi:8-oxo-dGTP diphosphatase